MPPNESAQSVPEDDPGYGVVSEEPGVNDCCLEDNQVAQRVRLAWWVRGFLLLMAAGLIGVLGVAVALKPYHNDGRPRTIATHMQLGLPPCNMVLMLGKPCPACGMTTSVSLLAHGDVLASLRANWVGTLLALYWLALIPWALISAIRGKLYGIRNGEWLLSISVGTIFMLMMGRWLWIMLN